MTPGEIRPVLAYEGKISINFTIILTPILDLYSPLKWSIKVSIAWMIPRTSEEGRYQTYSRIFYIDKTFRKLWKLTLIFIFLDYLEILISSLSYF